MSLCIALLAQNLALPCEDKAHCLGFIKHRCLARRIECQPARRTMGGQVYDQFIGSSFCFGRQRLCLARLVIHQLDIDSKSCSHLFRDRIVHLEEGAKTEILHRQHTAPHGNRRTGPLLTQKTHMMFARKKLEALAINKSRPKSQMYGKCSQRMCCLFHIELHIHVPHLVRLPSLHTGPRQIDHIAFVLAHLFLLVILMHLRTAPPHWQEWPQLCALSCRIAVPVLRRHRQVRPFRH